MTVKRSCCIDGCKRQGKLLTRVCKDGQEHYIGYTCSEKHRGAAQEAKRLELADRSQLALGERSCESVVAEYLSEYAERRKASSLDTARGSLSAGFAGTLLIGP